MLDESVKGEIENFILEHGSKATVASVGGRFKVGKEELVTAGFVLGKKDANGQLSISRPGAETETSDLDGEQVQKTAEEEKSWQVHEPAAKPLPVGLVTRSGQSDIKVSVPATKVSSIPKTKEVSAPATKAATISKTREAPASIMSKLKPGVMLPVGECSSAIDSAEAAGASASVSVTGKGSQGNLGKPGQVAPKVIKPPVESQGTISYNGSVGKGGNSYGNSWGASAGVGYGNNGSSYGSSYGDSYGKGGSSYGNSSAGSYGPSWDGKGKGGWGDGPYSGGKGYWESGMDAWGKGTWPSDGGKASWSSGKDGWDSGKGYGADWWDAGKGWGKGSW